MSIKICDSIMGSGKTSAAFNYIINHKNKKYIFITPYLKESDRVINECNISEAWFDGEYWGEYPSEMRKQIDFYQPTEIKGAKLNGLKSLLKEKKNVVTTHALFNNFDSEVIELVAEGEYTLIIDEAPAVIETYDEPSSSYDRKLLFNALVDIKDIYTLKWREQHYYGRFDDIKKDCDNGLLGGCVYDNSSIIMKIQPISTFTCFKDVLILTYMFDGQFLKYYFDLNKIEYNYCVFSKTNNGNYVFEDVDKLPSSSIDKSLINIYDGNYNEIGEGKYALSKNWYKNAKVDEVNKLDKLKRCNKNYIRNHIKTKADDVIWTCFEEFESDIEDKGFINSWVALNCKATNDYKNRSTVCYLVNRFVRPDIKKFFKHYGITIDEDKFALSELLQFLWRSCIRENKPINLYLPSERMRKLLIDWLNNN